MKTDGGFRIWTKDLSFQRLNREKAASDCIHLFLQKCIYLFIRLFAST